MAENALTTDQLEQAYQYFMQRGVSLAGLPDGDANLQNKYLAPVLEYVQGGTSARFVRMAVSMLQGADAFDTWKQKTGNENASFDDFLKEFKGDPFRYEDFTPEQLADLALTWEKLTDEEKDSLKLRFADLSEDDIDELQLPAKAATAAAVLAAQNAEAAAANVQDGKTTQFAIGAVSKSVPGGNPSVLLKNDGEDAAGNPKKKFEIVMPTGDTGPKGNVMFATFNLNVATGELEMFTDEEYTGANFALEDGVLIVEI